MKKLTLFIIMVLLAIINGCERNNQIDDSSIILKNELNSMTHIVVEPILISTPCNPSNNYDAWGEALFNGISKLIYEIHNSGLSKGDFINKLNVTVPEKFLIIDTLGVNLRKVDLAYKEFLSLFIKRNFFEALQISIKMENYVSQTGFLTEVDKRYLLKIVSILRYSTYIVYSNNSKSAPGNFEKCWIRKLQEMENSGFFERLACVYSWPVCFGAMLGDCAIEVLS